MNVDVAVIGAGPAGSTLAALLARRGMSVCLIDREEFPRDKVCGEFLSYDALPILERLGVADQLDALGAPRIERCRVVGRTRDYEFGFPQAARGISRFALDELLLRHAVASGALPRIGWTAVDIDPASRTVTIERNGERDVVEARVIAGAWGRWGRFDAQLNRTFVRDRAHRSFGFKRHYRAETVMETIDLYSFRGGYLGVSPVEGGITNICGLAHASRLAKHRGRWEGFVEMIRGEESRLESLYAAHVPAQENFLSSEPVIFRARSPVEQGIVMIGDASGVIDPLTGNGMAMAIQSAALAAPHIAAIVNGKVEAAREYSEAHKSFFDGRIAWSRRIALLLSRPALLDAVLRTFHPRAAGEFLLRATRAGDGDVAHIVREAF
ncbi:MAG: NAD(P)/FAD-dependent oxidoreductase [Thermoanaerobaculia bacterium]|nr:NAD(P)/FAD-dependent oxidoreductase [Thermoanaerobaculia bacterium]